MTSASDTTTSTACEARIEAKFAEDRNVPGRSAPKMMMTTTQAIGSASASNDFPDSTERRRLPVAPSGSAGSACVVGLTCWSDVMREPSAVPSSTAAVRGRHRCARRAAQAVLGYPLFRHVLAGQEPDQAAAGDHADPVTDRGQLLVVGAGA